MSILLRRLLMRGGYMAPEGGEGGGGGGSTPPAGTPPQPREPETFSKDYVRELREENKGWRLKSDEHKKAADAAQAAADAAKADAERVKAEAKTAADQRVIRAELKAAALKAGMVDLDGLKLADLSKVKLNEETGDVEGADALMAELKKSKPYLFGAANTSSTSTPPGSAPPGPKNAKAMTAEDYAAAKKDLTGAR